MYYGTITKELEMLYKKYEEKWGYDLSGCEDVEYSDETYDEYVAEINKALEQGIEFPCTLPDYDDEF